MRKPTLILRCVVPILVLGLLLSCQRGEQVDDEIEITGGWGKATPNESVRAAAAFAAKQIPNDTLQSIENPQQQVVAGMNYRFTLQMNSGRKWKAQVYEDLSGEMQVTELNPIDP